LKDKLLAMLDDPQRYYRAIRQFHFTGLEVMRQRMAEFRGEVVRERKVVQL
jgi:hypothetical protein